MKAANIQAAVVETSQLSTAPDRPPLLPLSLAVYDDDGTRRVIDRAATRADATAGSGGYHGTQVNSTLERRR